MKSNQKFKFDAQHSELISKSFGEFKNDVLKDIAANETIGGSGSKPFIKVTLPFM